MTGRGVVLFNFKLFENDFFECYIQFKNIIERFDELLSVVIVTNRFLVNMQLEGRIHVRSEVFKLDTDFLPIKMIFLIR